MNERIQELLVEAHRQTKGGIYNGHPSEWSEKFALLIVRECIDWCNAHARDDGTAQRIAEDIKKDFGVEV